MDAGARRRWRLSPAGLVWATGTVAACTAVCWALFPHVDRANLILIYLSGTAFVATRFGRGPAVVAAGLSVATFDVCFVPPYMTLVVAEPQYLITLAVMLAVALLISGLALRAMEQADTAARLAREADAERVRSTLLSSLSHDFRTPLATITGAASTLLDDAHLSRDAERDLKEAIRDEAERLHRTLTSILDLTRLESGALALDLQWHPLEEIVGAALARVDRRVAGRDVRIVLPHDLPLVLVDAVLLERLLVNLLDNAARHAPGSPITVAASARPSGVELRVEDEGPGLPTGAPGRLFQPFFQAEGSRRHGGFGLGLAICRAIAEAHGGTITAADRSPRGAAFSLVLPATGRPPVVEAEVELARP